MGYDGRWFFFAVPPAVHERLAPAFQAARAAGLPEATERALAHWRSEPDFLERELARPVTDFLNAFWPRPFAELFDDRIVRDEFPGFDLAACNVLSVSLDRFPPPALVWQGLGPERAARLPCFFGNLLVRPDEVRPALDRACEAFDVPAEVFFRRTELLWWSTSQRRRDVLDARDALPAALNEAAKRGTGLLGITTAL